MNKQKKHNTWKRCLCIVFVLVLGITALSGCGAKKEASSDEYVKLKWVFGGPGKLADSDRVWALFNEKLAEYIPNTEIEFVCIPHADYAEKWRLMSASQEQVDIVWVSWALNFAEEVSKGSYLDITDLVEKYGQDMQAGFPDWLLDLTSIDGRIYAIPNYQMMTNPNGFSIEKSHVDNGWLDIQAAEALLTGDKMLTKSDYKMFEDYFTKVLASDEKVKYVSWEFLKRGIKEKIGLPAEGLERITGNAVVKRGDKGYKVYDLISDFPESYQYYDLMNEWYNKGIIRKDILETPSEKEGKYLLWWSTVLKGAKERVEAKRGVPMEVFGRETQLYVNYNGVSTSTALASTCSNPERAMQVLNLLNSEKGAELLNLLSYGIEGEHYKKISDKRIEWLGAGVPGSSNNKYGYENWALGNALVSYTTQNDPEDWNEYIQNDVNMKAEISPLAGFSLDLAPIKFEVAQYNAIMKEYEYLERGTTPNYKEILEQRNQKLREAGSEKIVAEVQRQIDEWAKAQGK